jgi:hypothetical protein
MTMIDLSPLPPVPRQTARNWAADCIVTIRNDDENAFRYESRLNQIEAAIDYAHEHNHYCPHANDRRIMRAAIAVLQTLIDRYAKE